MAWKNLGFFSVKDSWVLTPPVTAELFRIKHLKIYQPDKYYLKAAITQAFKDNSGLNMFDSRRFSYRPEPELFQFAFPVGLGQHSLAFKRLDDSKISWWIEVKSFFTEDAELDYLNYLQARFNNISIEEVIMALYPRPTSQLEDFTVNSGELNVDASTPILVLGSNKDRRKLVVRTGLEPVTLSMSFDDEGNPVGILEEVPANFNYELPTTDSGAYRGDIYAFCYQDTKVSFSEFCLKTELSPLLGEDDQDFVTDTNNGQDILPTE